MLFLMIYWLVVLTMLKNISQWEGLSHIFWKIKKMKPPTSLYMFDQFHLFKKKQTIKKP